MFIPEDIDQRIEQNEWCYLIEKYPHVAFNIKPDRPRANGVKLDVNSPEHGFRHLIQLEPYNELPQQWDPEVLKHYETIITYNRKWYEDHKHHLNLRLISGCSFFNNFYRMSNPVPYEEKIDGVCFINKCYNIASLDSGHIAHQREELVMALNIAPKLKHVWSSAPWGGEFYQGPTAVYRPGHTETLNLINKYRFRLGFESLYHPYWSWDFITERISDCFKAKTIPIYLGCYNIEDHVPLEFIIDYREFDGVDDLSAYLRSYDYSGYQDQVEAAYEWNKTSRIGSVEDLEIILRELK